MPHPPDKTQIGIRLPAEAIRHIDAKRQNSTRAEFCRHLIEAGLAGIAGDQRAIFETVGEMIGSLQQELGEIRESAILAERDAERSLAEIARLRTDLATAVVGLLTKLGQVVREEDQRQFAREKAERFVKRVLLTDASDQERKS